jgi:hypothetical protein
MSLITKRSIKLYDHLTSKQKAAVALGIYDADELSVIASTVERKTYTQLDDAYISWSDYAFKISTVLGMTFWQAKASEYKLKHGIRGAALVSDDERTDDAMVERERVLMADVIAAVPKAQAKQKAALDALQTLAKENGFQFADCLKLASIEPEEVYRLESVEPVQSHLDYLLNNLREAAPR